jgi:hypothetical protein
MNRKSLLLLGAALCVVLTTAHAQPGPRGGLGGLPPGPRFGGDLAKIFGDNSAFSADLECHMLRGGTPADAMTMPGKMAYLTGQSRFEMDMTLVKSKQLSPQAAAQMKQMGLDKLIVIGRPDRKVSYMVYPGLAAYVENPIAEAQALQAEADYKLEATELGKDTVDGHPCVKNKVLLTGKDGKAHESTVWNATDLKKFPVKIETIQDANTVTMLFTNVKLAKPDATQFDPPADFKKYESMMGMMQQEMMKRLGGGAGLPPR